MSLNEISKVILESNKIAITFHTSPDGDAVGSALGLLNALRELGKEVYVIARDVIPDNLSFLPLGEEINDNIKEPVEGTDLVVVLDCGNVDRISGNISNYKGNIINIDHHKTNEMYGTINYVDIKSAATAELIYLLLKEIGFQFNGKDEVFEKIGKCIYTALVTDTGSFRHSNVTERTHKIASELIAVGVQNTKVHNNLFDNRAYNKVKLMGIALSSLELYIDNKVSYISITSELLDSLGMIGVDTSDISSIALGIKGVEVSVVAKDSDNDVKASLRSKNDFDVSKVAEYFGGGGHTKAAGLKILDISLEEAREEILKQIEEEM